MPKRRNIRLKWAFTVRRAMLSCLAISALSQPWRSNSAICFSLGPSRTYWSVISLPPFGCFGSGRVVPLSRLFRLSEVAFGTASLSTLLLILPIFIAFTLPSYCATFGGWLAAFHREGVTLLVQQPLDHTQAGTVGSQKFLSGAAPLRKKATGGSATKQSIGPREAERVDRLDNLQPTEMPERLSARRLQPIGIAPLPSIAPSEI